VIVFLHGGNHVGGAAADHDGRRLAAAADAVVVIVNYRLGAFGWLAHPALAESAAASNGTGSTDGGRAAGNYGLLDQLAALRWVRDEIAAFGGDPARVTLLGHSAGAVDACNLLAMPAAAQLFSRVWLASGSCFAITLEHAAKMARAVAADLGCADEAGAAACLRALPADRLARAVGATSSDLTSGVGYYPVIDGTLLADAPLALLRAGRAPKLPVVLGTTRDEMLGIVESFVTGELRDAAAYASIVQALYGTWATSVLDAYPLLPASTPRATLAAVLSDQLTVCPMRRLGRALVERDHDTQRYIFAYRFREPALAALGASHGIDLAFLFDDFRVKGTLAPTPDERALSADVMRRLAAFAATGELPSAPKLTATAERHLVWDTTPRDEPLEHPRCDRWDSVQDPR
jgi:para-nitrobenzyl esterase